MRKLLILAALAVLGLIAGTGQATAADITVFTVTLAPSGDADGSGVAVLRVNLDKSQVCYQTVVRNIGEPVEPAPGIGSAHIHTTLTGGVFINLLTDFRATGADVYLASGCVTATQEQLQAILNNPHQYYVNVHTVAFPAGAIQGSLR
jgi:hypothetical protein